MKLDPIYYNATRKLALILNGNIDGASHEFEINTFAKKNRPQKKYNEKIGIYKNVIIGEKGICFYCESKVHTNRDHFFPRSIGGILVVHSCYACNHAKGSLLPSEWIKKVEKATHYKHSKKEVIVANTRKLLDKIINDGLETPCFI